MGSPSETTRNETFLRLPGLEVPLGKALGELSKMWDAPPDSGSRAPSEFRASRMNFILHFGFDSTPQEAFEQFQLIIDFSQRYPCRVLALCPAKGKADDESHMVCKIFSECFIGANGTDMSCCEAIVFGYNQGQRDFLEDQISVFSESDLPTYYWPYKFDSAQRLSNYQTFFKESERIVFDTAVECFPPEQIDLPEPDKLHDLAYARVLPIRQCLGQFLSRFSVESIVSELHEVVLSGPKSFRAEGAALLAWIEQALNDCFDRLEEPASKVKFDQETSDTSEREVKIAFVYGNRNNLQCVLTLDSGEARIKASLGSDTHTMTAKAGPLDSASALAEALFFG